MRRARGWSHRAKGRARVQFLVLAGMLALLVLTVTPAPAAVGELNPELWDRAWGEYTENEAPHGIAPDGQGNLYAIINSVPVGGDGSQRVANLVKFNSNGYELWHVPLGRVSVTTFSVSADRAGNAYVYGYEREIGTTLRKFDPAGNLLWTTDRDSTFGHVSVDPKGEAVYVTSAVDVGPKESPNWAVILSKYKASNGENSWNLSIDTDGTELAAAVAAGSKEIYVAGETNGSFPGYKFSGNGMDGFLARVKPDGTVEWIKQQGGVYFTDLAVDRLGRAYTTQSQLLNGYPVATSAARFEKDSKVYLKIPLHFKPSKHTGIAVDAMGTIYVSGAVYDESHPNISDLGIEKYDSAGMPQFIKSIDRGVGPYTVRVGNSGDIYTAYIKQHYNNVQTHVVKYEGDLIDTDGDGLPDRWERDGVWVEGTFVDLPKMGADPLRKDVFVEVDMMVGIWPKSGALELVTEAFRNAPVENPDGSRGISLHIDSGPHKVMNPKTGEVWGELSKANRVPWQEELGSTVPPDGDYLWDEFDLIKESNFAGSRRPIFHYALLANNLGGLGTTSGVSRGVPGSDFIVSLGGWDGGGTPLEQAGTFMHELGHNLNLGHGGEDDVPYKPNYLSVMNYAFQTAGLIKKDAHGRFVAGHLDFSVFDDISDLDENELDESVGLTSRSGNPLLEDYGTKWYLVEWSPWGPRAFTKSSKQIRPLDWNQNGGIDWERFVASNLNAGPEGDHDDELSILKSYEDWNRLIYKGGAIGLLGAGEDELPRRTPDLREFTREDDKAQGHEYKVLVTAPESGGIQPGGSSVTYVFTVTNDGIESDNYLIEATSSAGWADLSGVPASLPLEPSESAEIPIVVSVPATPGPRDELTLTAVSQENPRMWDSDLAVTLLQPASLGTEQKIAETGSGMIGGVAVHGDWMAWAKTETIPGSPTTYYVRNLVTGEERQLRTISLSYAASYPTIDMHGDKVVYEAGYIYVYDLTSKTETAIIPSTGLRGHQPRIWGDRVVYNSDGDIYVYDLAAGEERKVDSGSFPAIYRDRIIWRKSSSGHSDLEMLDLATGAQRSITANGSAASEMSPQIYGDRIVWEDDREGPWNVYVYDLATDTESRVSGSSSYRYWPVISGDIIAMKKTVQDTPTTTRTDIYVHDLNSGAESLVASRVYWPNTSSAMGIDSGRIVYAKGTPRSLFMTTLKLAPETSLSTTPGAPGAIGWFNTPPQITLTSDSAGASTFYQWDSKSDLGWTGYTGAFEAPEGEHTLYYYSVDELGNTESVKSRTFKVDTIAPTTEITISPSLGQVFGVLPEITLTSGEAGSTTRYRWDEGSWNTYSGTFTGIEGEHTLYYYSTDAHGNTEEVQRRAFMVDLSEDTTAPLTTISVEPALGEDEEFYAASPVVTLSVDESAVTYYSWDAPMEGIPARVALPAIVDYDTYATTIGAPTLYWGKFVAPEGIHTLYYYSVDAAGNVEPVQTRRFEVGSRGGAGFPYRTRAGWNLVAGGPDSDTGGRVIFGFDSSGFYSAQASSMVAGRGYWVNTPDSTVLDLDIQPPPVPVSLVPGWNLIGNSSGVPVKLPAGLVAFVFDGGFVSTTTLQPGEGAWIKAATEQFLELVPVEG